MVVIKHSLDVRSSVQCMNVNEWDKHCQPLLDAPYNADYAAIHHCIGEKNLPNKAARALHCARVKDSKGGSTAL